MLLLLLRRRYTPWIQLFAHRLILFLSKRSVALLTAVVALMLAPLGDLTFSISFPALLDSPVMALTGAHFITIITLIAAARRVSRAVTWLLLALLLSSLRFRFGAMLSRVVSLSMVLFRLMLLAALLS